LGGEKKRNKRNREIPMGTNYPTTGGEEADPVGKRVGWIQEGGRSLLELRLLQRSCKEKREGGPPQEGE